MRDYNDKIVANGRDQGVLLTQISNYIKTGASKKI